MNSVLYKRKKKTRGESFQSRAYRKLGFAIVVVCLCACMIAYPLTKAHKRRINAAFEELSSELRPLHDNTAVAGSASSVYKAGTATAAAVLPDCGGDCKDVGDVANAADAAASIADGVDCRSFLEDYRNKKIDAMETDHRWSQSYVTRSNTPKPFYWSTHNTELDPVRGTSFAKGFYYETELSNRIIETFDAKMEEGNTSSIFLDVGGNIGWFALLAAAHGARVYTFEPNPANVVRICESLSLNNWLSNDRRKDFFVPIPKGVGDVPGTQTFYHAENEKNPGSFTFDANSVAGRQGTAAGQIEIITLDLFAETHGWFDERPSIGFFKLDVEGYETQVLEGAQKLFKSGIVELFEMEMQPGKPSAQVSRIIDIVFNSGYELYMHGRYQGPNKKVGKKYTSHEELAEDIIARMYLGNLLFRRKS